LLKMFLEILLTLLLPSADSLMVTMQPNGSFPDDPSYVQWRNRFLLPEFSVSVCIRFRQHAERGMRNWLFSYSVPTNNDKLNLHLDHKKRLMVLCLSGSRGFENCFQVPFKPHELRGSWVHVCAVLSGLDPNSEWAGIKIFLQGLLVLEDPFKTILDPATDGKGIMILGQEQDTFGGGFDPRESFSGQIAQFNMFTRELGASEIKSMFTCNGDPKGDLIEWTQSKWAKEGEADFSPIRVTEFCAKPFSNDMVIIPEAVTFADATNICESISGELYSADDPQYSPEDLYQKLKTETDPGSNCQLPSGDISYWQGNRWDEGGQSWMGYRDNKTVSRELTVLKEPSPGELCLTNEFGTLRPRKCDNKFCAFCKKSTKKFVKEERTDPKPILLKGLCKTATEEDFIFDTEFYPSGMQDGRIYFRGVRSSHMYYKAGERESPESWTGNWRIESLKDPNQVLILSTRNSQGYPFGRFDWQMGPEAGVCGKEPAPSPNSFISLTLSSCPEETFTCDSGACIPLANKCNSKIDCFEDESDESHCSYLEVPPNYAGQLSPRSTGSEAVPVFVNVSILAFPVIDTVNLAFTADYYINLRWYDGRLNFKDLNDNSLLNGVQTEALVRLWAPQLAFTNALGPFQTVVDELSVATIVLESNPWHDDISQSLEYYGFSAYENSLNLQREYYQEFACEFDLVYYPFDTQVCHMVFALQGFTKEFIAMEGDGIGVEYLGKRQLLEYEIQDWKLFIDNTGEMSQAEVKIVFRRNIEYHVYGVFLQQLILLIVGFLTFFFEVTNFSDRTMVSLTLMLVIATISASIQQSLPATPYFKMIDIWLFFSMNLMVVCLIFHTYLEYVVQTVEKSEKSADVYRRPSIKTVYEPMPDDRPRSTMSILRRNTGAKVLPSDIDEDDHQHAKRVNRMGIYLYIGVVVGFFTIFWIAAFVEFFTPSSAYMNRKLD